ncbi:30S ribosomal protein S8 [Candidatus Woesearchaeota archaeon]|nr:30S ribosomal protein S8 [Candidatus Woesearchaeota archaeon]
MITMLNDSLASALAKINNAERVGKKETSIAPASKMVKYVLTILNEQRYLGAFEEAANEQGGLLKINLLGNINNLGAIKPRFSSKKHQFEKWEKRYLPAKGFGIIIVSTPLGLMTHAQAKEKNVGGRLIAYCY